MKKQELKKEEENTVPTVLPATEDTEVSMPVEVAGSDVVYAQDKAQVDMQISTAKTYPRNILKSVNEAITVVTLDKEIASSCTYAVPRGGKSISGPSVHLARILAQSYGNMRIEAKVVSIDAKQITSRAVCFDLEKNLAIAVEVKRSIVSRTKGRFNEDMITVTGNAANAIALRNAIFNVIPRAVVDKVYKAAIQTITGDISDRNKFIAKRNEVVSSLKNFYKVTEEQICFALGIASIEIMTVEELVILIGIGTALKEGDTSVEQAFKNQKSAAITVEELKELFEKNGDKLNAEEFEHAKRILDNKEVDNYTKLHKLLTK